MGLSSQSRILSSQSRIECGKFGTRSMELLMVKKIENRFHGGMTNFKNISKMIDMEFMVELLV